MKYYVVADTHGFYTPLCSALESAGFFAEKQPHKLVVCGDMMDRGPQAVKMQEFMKRMLDEDRLIFVRGNHEDLMEAMLIDISTYRPVSERHEINGTWSTALQLSDLPPELGARFPTEVARRVKNSIFFRDLIPASIDYFETEHYVFVHGWIPAYSTPPDDIDPEGGLHCRADWREATLGEWRKARWYNGMECACVSRYGIPDKTVVCGHWRASYGHAQVHGEGSVFGEKAIFTPFYDKGIIALDACAAYSGFINCIVLED